MEKFTLEQREVSAALRENIGHWLELRQTIWFYVGLLVSNFIAVYLLPTNTPWGLILAGSTIAFLCALWPLCTREKLIQGRLWPGRARLIFLAVPFISMASYLGTLGSNWLAMRLLGLHEFQERTSGLDRFNEAQYPLWAMVVSICLTPGIFEELFFRGFLQGVLEKSLTVREAWIVQAIIFAIAHLNPLGFFTYLIWLGLLLGWLRNRTGSLLPGMLAHFGHNLLVVLHARNWLGI